MSVSDNILYWQENYWIKFFFRNQRSSCISKKWRWTLAKLVAREGEVSNPIELSPSQFLSVIILLYCSSVYRIVFFSSSSVLLPRKYISWINVSNQSVIIWSWKIWGVMIHYHLNIQFFTILSMWQGGSSP
jgi:hypothetical protein